MILSTGHSEGLSSTEADILDQVFHNGETDQKLLTPDVRRKICKNLDISPQNLNNYITKLKKKGFIITNKINPKINLLYLHKENNATMNINITTI